MQEYVHLSVRMLCIIFSFLLEKWKVAKEMFPSFAGKYSSKTFLTKIFVDDRCKIKEPISLKLFRRNSRSMLSIMNYFHENSTLE